MPTITPDTKNEEQQPEAARLLSAVERIAVSLERLADHFAPHPPDIVGTSYVAHRLACTQVWITDMIRQGDIPKSCIVPGTGNGKVWKLYRRKIDKWIGNHTETMGSSRNFVAESAIDGQTSAQAQQTGVPLLPSPSHRPKVVKADATARRTGRLGRLPKEFETSTAISVRSSLITAGGPFASDLCVRYVVSGHENTGRAETMQGPPKEILIPLNPKVLRELKNRMEK